MYYSLQSEACLKFRRSKQMSLCPYISELYPLSCYKAAGTLIDISSSSENLNEYEGNIFNRPGLAGADLQTLSSR